MPDDDDVTDDDDEWFDNNGMGIGLICVSAALLLLIVVVLLWWYFSYREHKHEVDIAVAAGSNNWFAALKANSTTSKPIGYKGPCTDVVMPLIQAGNYNAIKSYRAQVGGPKKPATAPRSASIYRFA